MNIKKLPLAILFSIVLQTNVVKSDKVANSMGLFIATDDKGTIIDLCAATQIGPKLIVLPVSCVQQGSYYANEKNLRYFSGYSSYELPDISSGIAVEDYRVSRGFFGGGVNYNIVVAKLAAQPASGNISSVRVAFSWHMFVVGRHLQYRGYFTPKQLILGRRDYRTLKDINHDDPRENALVLERFDYENFQWLDIIVDNEDPRGLAGHEPPYNGFLMRGSPYFLVNGEATFQMVGGVKQPYGGDMSTYDGKIILYGMRIGPNEVLAMDENVWMKLCSLSKVLKAEFKCAFFY